MSSSYMSSEVTSCSHEHSQAHVIDTTTSTSPKLLYVYFGPADFVIFQEDPRNALKIHECFFCDVLCVPISLSQKNKSCRNHCNSKLP